MILFWNARDESSLSTPVCMLLFFQIRWWMRRGKARNRKPLIYSKCFCLLPTWPGNYDNWRQCIDHLRQLKWGFYHTWKTWHQCFALLGIVRAELCPMETQCGFPIPCRDVWIAATCCGERENGDVLWHWRVGCVAEENEAGEAMA